MKTSILLTLCLVAACGGKSSAPTGPSTTEPTTASSDSATLVISMNGATVTATLLPDGAINVTIQGGDKSDAKTGKFADGQLFDHKGEVVAKLGADGTVTTRMVTETASSGSPTQVDVQWQDVGIVDAEGTFTAKGKPATFAIGADGTVTGLPSEVTVKIDAKSAELKRRAMFMLVASLGGGTARVTTDATSAPATK